jgi:hypothetical protein
MGILAAKSDDKISVFSCVLCVSWLNIHEGIRNHEIHERVAEKLGTLATGEEE